MHDLKRGLQSANMRGECATGWNLCPLGGSKVTISIGWLTEPLISVVVLGRGDVTSLCRVYQAQVQEVKITLVILQAAYSLMRPGTDGRYTLCGQTYTDRCHCYQANSNITALF